MSKLIYFNDKLLNTDYADSLVDAITNLSMRKGDSFNWFPFNSFGEDKKDGHRGEQRNYHTAVRIVDIKVTMVDSWNGRIRPRIEVFLTEDTHQKNG